MIPASFSSINAVLVGVAACLAALLTSFSASAQKFEIKSIAEKKIPQLPSGPLFWRIENFPTLLKRKRQRAQCACHRSCGKGLAVHPRCEVRIDTGRHQSRGSRSCAILLCT